MMPARTLRRAGSIAAALLIVASCSNDDVATDATTPAETATTVGAEQPNPNDLSQVCFSPIVVQTDWFPQAEHGGIYELLGDDYQVDAERGATTGSLVFRGVDTGVDLEIRAGGPFIESPVVTEMFLDGSIMFGYVGTDAALSRQAETPTLAVFNALSVNPQVIMWDATKHPDAKTIADIAAEVSAISVFGDRPFMRYLVGEGVVPADKVDGNYKGNLLLTTDDVAHQGFATSEPYRYLNLDSGAISVAYQLLHDTGWTSYPQNLAINKLRLDALRGCLTKLVPMMQHAQLDYIAAPQRTNAIIIAAVKAFDTFWTQDESLTAYAVDTMLSLGIIANGDTPTFGDFESPRIDDFITKAIPILRA
ncbi:MAG: ABC transporter substrate-binding protein, partial [Actinobacteria bacterium]|nr:ABC transporter substrate-binding protein [Actinomycetota bacterium]